MSFTLIWLFFLQNPNYRLYRHKITSVWSTSTLPLLIYAPNPRLLHSKLRGAGTLSGWWMPSKPRGTWTCNCTPIPKPQHLPGCAHPMITVLSSLDGTTVLHSHQGFPHHAVVPHTTSEDAEQAVCDAPGEVNQSVTSKTCLFLKSCGCKNLCKAIPVPAVKNTTDF